MNEIELIRRWWGQRDQYDWISSYLVSRDLQRFTQLMTAAIIVALGLIPVALLFSPAGASGLVGRTTVAIVACGCLIMALLWIIRWPTRVQSAVFAVASTLCIAAVSVVEHDPLSALTATAAFAVMGGYVALWHTARLMVFTLTIAISTAVFLAARLAIETGDVVLALSKLLLILIIMLSIPMAVQALIQYLGEDALKSDIDPLCGLLNRRAFYRSTEDLLESRHREGDRYLVLAMFDLDGFKLVNDTKGHAYGDQALIGVSEVLRRQSRSAAVIARAGGEEFFVADTYATVDRTMAADRLRSAIAATPFDITASVGVAKIELAGIPVGGRREAIDALIEAADRAMYEAKRAGGNRTHHGDLIVGGLAAEPTDRT